MRILKEEPRNDKITLRVENLDDLWELSHIINAGDRVKGRTERKIQMGADRTSQVRKTLTLEIEVEDVSLEHDILRVQGVITEGPEDLISYGDHHSIGFGEGDNITITKNWDSLSKQRLERAANTKPLNILVVVFDRENAIFAELTRRGFEIIQTLKGEVAKKAPGGGKENFWNTLAAAIKELHERKNYSRIIAASPAFWNDYLFAVIPESLGKVMSKASCSEVSENGIKEVLKRPELVDALKADRTSKEEVLVKNLLEAISKDKACYGLDDCEEKTALGQVKLLLVTQKAIEESRERGEYDRLDSLLESAKGMNAEIHLLEHSPGQVDSLGGVAGVLRW